MEDGRVFEIEKIQPAERIRFPTAHFRTQSFSFGFVAYLSRQEITEMFPEELFELLQIAIVVERAREVSLAVPLPMRKELL